MGGKYKLLDKYSSKILPASIEKMMLLISLQVEDHATARIIPTANPRNGEQLYNIHSGVIYFRRASTITGWTNWIMNQIEE